MMTASHPLLDQPRTLKDLDRSDMARLLIQFPHQVEDAIQIGENFGKPRSLRGPFDKVVFIGMGGSAIGGDVIRSLTASELAVPVWVWRHYDLPPFVDRKTLCIFSSYSGNTEETLSAFQQGRKTGLQSVIMTSGGELGRLSERHSVPWIRIPAGYPPRTALGYSVFPVLKLLSNLKIVKWDATAVHETLSCLKSLGKQCDLEMPLDDNPAKQLARDLHSRWVVIYAGTELLDTAALRFRNQIEENAKAMASHHTLPEMNHNEILGWQFPKEKIPGTACVFLRDGKDHPRIRLRMEFTKNHISSQGAPVFEIHSRGKSRLARLFTAIHLGDWVSLYLAFLYGIDPTPVAVIECLKKELAKVRS